MEKNYPQKEGISAVLSDAFSYWNRTLFYQILYSLLYLSLFYFGYSYLFRYFGLWDEFAQYQDLVRTDLPAFNKKMSEIAKLPQARNFALAVFSLFALINPLNVGFYKIYRKLDLNEKPEFNDLFAGYLGFDFFKFFGFYLFWMIIFTYANSLLMLSVAWFFITLFSIPLMFFMNVKTFEGISLTMKALRRDFVTILISIIVAAIFSVSGILLFGVGFLFTFPFWNAVIYTLYQRNFHEN